MKFFSFDTQKEPCTIALGFFDGVHLGHQEVIKSAAEEAKKRKISCSVFTFSDKKSLLYKKSGRIYSDKFRIRLIKKCGADNVIMPDFSDFCNVSPEEFVKALKSLGAVALFCGIDFRFGKNAEGNTTILKELCQKEGIDLFITQPILVEGNRVSSTEIRRAIREGNIPLANKLLGDNYVIEGRVISGKMLGRKALYPTVNQSFFENEVIPKKGVYVSKVLYNGKTYPAVTNIGVCPTVGELASAVCETYIIDEEIELYGEIIEVMPLFFLREEKKFSSIEELKEQISKDVDAARKIK